LVKVIAGVVFVDSIPSVSTPSSIAEIGLKMRFLFARRKKKKLTDELNPKNDKYQLRGAGKRKVW
jgi:hypothetical protein